LEIQKLLLKSAIYETIFNSAEHFSYN